MAGWLPPSGERLVPEQVTSREEHLQYLRHIFAYEWAGAALAGRARVLDFGCGEGYGTAMLAGHVGEAVGVDVDEPAIAHATAKHASARCRYLRYGGERLPFDDGAFDGVVSFQVLEHIRTPELYASEAARVLKPGGRFILTTPNRANRLDPGQKPWNRFHVREYEAAELEDLLAGCFAGVHVSGVSATPAVHAIEMERVRQARRITAMDVLNLRRLIPERLKPVVGNLARRIMPVRKTATDDADWKSRYAVGDYFVTEDGLADCLDLLAVCTR